MISFFTSRYTTHLEQQVSELQSQLAIERQEVRRLTSILIPALQRAQLTAESKRDPQPKPKVEHRIVKAADQKSASCGCGWKFESDEPVELQTAISEHYKLEYPAIRPKGRSWVEYKAKNESMDDGAETPQRRQA